MYVSESHTFQYTIDLSPPPMKKKAKPTKKTKVKKPPKQRTSTSQHRGNRTEYARARAQRPDAKEVDRNRKKKRRQERLTAGLCYRCSELAIPGTAYCEPCRTIILDRQAKYRKAKRQTPEGREQKRLQDQKYRQEKKAAGICQDCSKKAIPGQTRCEACRDKHNQTRKVSDAKRREETKKTASTET